ncbi:MAG: hypothetical protein ACPGRZ_12555 [Alphaproteobacteria bacterium]
MRLAEDLPDGILRDVDRLTVDRNGRLPESFMVTEGITGHVAPGQGYRIANADLVPTDGEDAQDFPPVTAPASAPPHVRLTGTWDGGTGGDPTLGNIFGGVGTLTLDRTSFEIPAIASTPEALGFFGASLIGPEDTFSFHADIDLPVTVTAFGRNYVDGFLHVTDLGVGSYIEYHDMPHLHMPLDEQAGGYMLIGRRDDSDYLITAFRIPFGQALYTAPEVLHADGYLIGRYMVIYAVTENYSNVIFRSPDGDPVNPVIREAV